MHLVLTNSENTLKVKKVLFLTLPFSLHEIKTSNCLITGLNQTGKSNLAYILTDFLSNQQGLSDNWQVIVFDVVGIWKRKSSIPYYFKLEKLIKVKIPEESIIFDISSLLISEQRQFIEKTLSDLWKDRVNQNNPKKTLLVFEESQLILRNIRSFASQNILRFFSVGANLNIRCFCICPSLTGIDTEIIRLCEQRYHFRLGNESNIKRKFKQYYGLDWVRVALNLNVGFFLYYLKGKLSVKHVNLFEQSLEPQLLHFVKYEPVKKKPKIVIKYLRDINPEPEEDEELDEDLDYFFLVENI